LNSWLRSILFLELPEVLRTFQDRMIELVAQGVPILFLERRLEVLRTFQDRIIELVAKEYLFYSWN
jgi:hypothetical protein